MTGPELKAALASIGWTEREAARRMAVHKSRVARMIADQAEIDDATAVWILTIASVHRALPRPGAWVAEP